MIGHGKRQTKQADHGTDEALGLPERQPEHRPQRQRGQDGEAGAVGLPAPGRASLCSPARNRLLGKPCGQAAALTQRNVVVAPIRHPAALPGNMMTVVGVGLERQGRHPEDHRQGNPPTPAFPARQPHGSMQHGDRRYHTLTEPELLTRQHPRRRAAAAPAGAIMGKQWYATGLARAATPTGQGAVYNLG